MARLKSGSVKKTTTVLVTSVDLASADVTGVLPVANGGTGSGSFTDGQILIGNTASGNTLTKATLTAGSNITITNGSGSITIAASSGGGLTNFTESTATYSGQVYVALVPNNAASDVNSVFSAKGNGYISAQIPTGTSSGGNNRGPYATDWQHKRNNASEVSSGYASVLSGGTRNTSSGYYSAVGGGTQNTASGQRSVVSGGIANSASNTSSNVAGGSNNTASGTFSNVGGGYQSIASGSHSCIPGGRQASTRSLYGKFSYASGQFGTQGDAQYGLAVLRRSSTSATPVVLTSDASTASTTNQIVLPNNSCFMIRGMAACIRTDSAGDRAEYEFSVGVYRGANAASTVIDYSNVDVRYESDATFDFTIAADTTNGGVSFSFTGASGKTVRSVVTAWSTEVTA